MGFPPVGERWRCGVSAAVFPRLDQPVDHGGRCDPCVLWLGERLVMGVDWVGSEWSGMSLLFPDYEGFRVWGLQEQSPKGNSGISAGSFTVGAWSLLGWEIGRGLGSNP